ncbi:MAG: hypothetical protein J5752_10185 [Clostridiales bacterium]|nr:hypothetical protein [Clostridiales bacterium]
MKKTGKMTACLMALFMLLPLSACKKKNNESDKTTSTTRKSGAAAAEVTDDYFEAKTTVLKVPVDENKTVAANSILSAEFVGEMILADYYQEYEKPEDFDELHATLQEQEKYYRRGQALFDLDGNLIKDITSDWSVLGAASDKDGKLWVLEASYAGHDATYLRVCPLKDDGSTDTEREVRFETTGAEFYEKGYLKITKEGYFVVSVGEGLTVYDAQGTKKYTITDSQRQVQDVLYEQDGKYYVISVNYTMDESSFSADAMLKELDIESGKFLKEKKFDSFLTSGSMVAGKEGIYASTSEGIFKVDPETAECTQVFDWNDTDVRMSVMSSAKCIPVNENEYYALGTDFSSESSIGAGYDQLLVHLTKASSNPHAGKKIITVGSMYANDTFLDYVYEYNTDHSNKYKIQLIAYDEKLEGVDGTEDTVLLDLMGENPPDILLNFDGWVPFSTESAMVDLNTYIDGPEGLDRSQFFDNVFRACETDGKMFHIPAGFGIECFVANGKLIPKRDGWTFDEFENIAKNLPDDVTFLPQIKKEDFLTNLVGMSLDKFVDAKNQKVDFNNDTFKKYLEIANTYGSVNGEDMSGADIEYIGDGMFAIGGDYITNSDKFQEGLLALTDENITGFMEYCMLFRSKDTEPYLIGYPNDSGEGLRAVAWCSLGITQASTLKDGAWEVIRGFLDYDKVSSGSGVSGFPVSRKALRAMCEEVMESNNERAKQDEKYIQSGWLSPKDATMKVEASDIDDFFKQIESINCSRTYDTSIMEIIEEEAKGYFSGSRSAEDVMKNIQNRASLVIQER